MSSCTLQRFVYGLASTGLTTVEAEKRLHQYGLNDANAAKQSPAWLRLAKPLGNPLVIILLLASALSAATGDLASFATIAMIVLLSVLLDFVQEAKAQAVIDALRGQIDLRANVCRDGVKSSLSVAQVVPSDIVELSSARKNVRIQATRRLWAERKGQRLPQLY